MDVHCYLLFVIRYFTRYQLDFDNSIHRDAKILRLSPLACPPSFWRGWTQEQIAKVVGLSRTRITEIVGNIKFDKIDNLLSEGRNMDYIDIMKRSGWETPISSIVPCLSEAQAHYEPEATQRFQPNPPSRPVAGQGQK